MLYRIHQKLGFTLVEILVVVTVLAVLVTLGLVAWRGIDTRAFNTRVGHAMTTYRDAFALYATQEKRYPSVPRSGSYCMHFGGLTGAEVNSRWSWLARPATVTAQSVTETSYFCRDFVETTTTLHASYPPLTKALESVSTINIPDENSNYLTDTYSGGIWARYSGTSTATTITIYGLVVGTACPTGTTVEWPDPSGKRAICKLGLDKQYPATYTGESWAWPT